MVKEVKLFKGLVPMRTDGKINDIKVGGRPLKNVESLGSVMDHLREAGLGPDLDEQFRKRGIDPTLPNEEIQQQLRNRGRRK